MTNVVLVMFVVLMSVLVVFYMWQQRDRDTRPTPSADFRALNTGSAARPKSTAKRPAGGSASNPKKTARGRPWWRR